MPLRAFLVLGVLLGMLSHTFAQPISAERKTKVLTEMQALVQYQAFVPGVDFSQWPTFLAKHQDEIASAEDVPVFVERVNSALQSFGISHIRLLSPLGTRSLVVEAAQSNEKNQRELLPEGNTLSWRNKSTAVLRIPSFGLTYDRTQIEGFIAAIHQKKAKALVLDLRGNGGGFVAHCTHLLSLLTPAGTSLGTQVSRQLTGRYIQETGAVGDDIVAIAKWAGPTSKTLALAQAPYLGKVAILLDKGSASASEITSAVLKEERGAVLVGAPSAGAVLVALYLPLEGTRGFEVQVPFSDYVSPHGMRLEKNPLLPDVAVEASPRMSRDVVLESALKTLK